MHARILRNGLIGCLTLAFLHAEDPPPPIRTLTLSGGAALTGQVLKEDSDNVWLDLGYDVLRIPLDRVSAQQAAADTQPEADQQLTDRQRLYHLRREPVVLPVETWVSRLGEGVVEVRSRAGQGSGFILNEEGYVLTNHHVIAGDRELTITVFSGADENLERIQYRNIRILAMDPVNDLALLAIEDELKKPLTWLPLAMGGDMRTGETVFAIGSPLGLDRTVSRGIVSLTDRLVGGVLFIQTTTQINPGNSGGPLLNLRGEVVGVNTLKLMSVGIEGVGFAVPSDTVKIFLNKRNAYAFDPRNPNTGYAYLNPPRKSEWTQPETDPESPTP